MNLMRALVKTFLVALSNIAARTATVTGTGVDMTDYEGVVAVQQLVGTVSGTTPTLDGKIQDSADNSAWADVPGATFTQVTASDSYQSINLDLDKVRRYVRYVGTIGGSSPSFTMGVFVRAAKKYA